MKQSWLIFVGILLFSLVLGLMTGASNSPVAGVVITGVLGVAVAILGLVTKKEFDFNLKLNYIGASLVLISIGLVAGIYFGFQWRVNDNLSNEEKKFVWDGRTPPKTAFEALDWALTKKLLISKGFSTQQVNQLYEIRIHEQTSYDNYSTSHPYYQMVIQTFSPPNTVPIVTLPKGSFASLEFPTNPK
jgi:hypothetical protein